MFRYRRFPPYRRPLLRPMARPFRPYRPLIGFRRFHPILWLGGGFLFLMVLLTILRMALR